MCGEHSCSGYWFDVRGGSSPRVWGAPREGSRTGGTPRLIPTCVGSTRAQCSWYDYGAAHPHVCGEHQAPVVSTSRRVGSSPRVWGAHSGVYRCGMPTRLIPPCVGSTPCVSPHAPGNPAHPHVCGEHGPASRLRFSQFGSSPRVWGARSLARVLAGAVRLIPTCVGSTLADMGFYPHTPSFRISLEPKASINPTRFLGLSPSGSAPIPASFAPPFSWP